MKINQKSIYKGTLEKIFLWEPFVCFCFVATVGKILLYLGNTLLATFVQED